MILGFTALQWYIIIVAFFAVIYLFTPQKNIWFPFVAITLLFSFLAYNLTPASTDDIMVYYHHMDIFRADGLDGVNYALEQNWFDWRTYRVSLMYFYLLSKFPNNHFLPATTILIVYSLGFYVLYKASKKFDISKFGLFLASMFFISTYWYYDTASGTRNGIAFAVVFACAYQQFAEKKHILFCIVGYVAAILMHSSGIVPVALVVATILTKKLNSKFVNFILLFAMMASGAIIEYLGEVTDSDFIKSIAVRAESQTQDYIVSGNTGFYVNVSVLIVIVLLLLYFGNYISKYSLSRESKMLYKFMVIVIFFSIGAMFSELVFVRFARWIFPLIGALIFMIGTKAQKDVEERRITEEMQNGMFAQRSLFLKLRPVVYCLFVVYTAVSFWYSLNGSSLIWLHF